MNKSTLTNAAGAMCVLVGMVSPLFAKPLFTMGLFALSGSLTNWLAIHMLFEKVPFLYGSGIIPLRFEQFKQGIRDLIMEQFFSKENIEKIVQAEFPASQKLDAAPLMAAVDFDRLFEKFKEAVLSSPFGGMLGMLGGAQALDPIKPHFIGKMREALQELTEDPKTQQALIFGFKTSIDQGALHEQIEKIVDHRLQELTPEKVKEIIQEMIREHLGWLVVWGGVFGGLIGLLSSAALG